MSKIEIKYEMFDITKLVNSVNIINDNYQIIKTLKKTNKKASYILEDNKKKLFFLKAKLRDFTTENEISVYKKIKNLNNDGINTIITIHQTQKLLLIISEYIDGFCIDDRLEMSDSEFQLFDNNLLNIFNKLVNTVYQLHLIGIIHCDIKPSNVLFKNINNSLIPILIDYDLSKIFNSRQNLCTVSKYYGTFDFCSPEAKEGIINKKTDVWNLGLLFYLFIFKKFINCNLNNLLDDSSDELIINYNLMSSYEGKHKRIVNLLNDMLTIKSVNRISIEELIKKIEL